MITGIQATGLARQGLACFANAANLIRYLLAGGDFRFSYELGATGPINGAMIDMGQFAGANLRLLPLPRKLPHPDP
jgi:hypothetical protein